MKLTDHLARFPERLKKRLRPFLDLTFWVLAIVVVVPLWVLDPPMVKTLLQWTAFAIALAGVAVLVTRIMLPHLDVSELMDQQRQPGGAVIIAGVCILLGLVFLAIVLWAKT